MNLKYAGPRPLISAKGVHFDKSKEDKHVYLSFVVELIKAVDHEYLETKPYSYPLSHLCSCDEYLSFLKGRYPAIVEEIEEHKKETEQMFEEELQQVRGNCFLCEEEKEAFIKNLSLMRNYRLQRTINKAAYYSGINYLAEVIHRERIYYVSAPILPIYFHIFHSVQGALVKRHPPMDSSIDIYERDAILHSRLNIRY